MRWPPIALNALRIPEMVGKRMKRVRECQKEDGIMVSWLSTNKNEGYLWLDKGARTIHWMFKS